MIGERSRQAWQLEGSSAVAYERYLVPAIFAPHARDLVDLAEPKPGERVLDVACGTGIVARTAAPRVGASGTVTGLDVNPGMLAVARIASSGLSPAIEWTEADADSLPFPDASFDVVFCEQALQFFGDRPTALREMRRVTAKDGRLALSVFRGLEHNFAYAVLSAALERHAGAEAGAMMRSPFALGDGEQIRALVSGAGFRDVRLRLWFGSERFASFEELLRQEAASSPLAGPLGRLDAAARDALLAEVAAAMRAYVDDDGIAFPNDSHMLLASP
jgi:ubiquinone/menaquinone biosynthesis C-methylase UbiE